MGQTVFSHTKEKRFSPYKNWIGIIEVEGKNILLQYPYLTIVRSNAVEWFKGQAKVINGQLTTVTTI